MNKLLKFGFIVLGVFLTTFLTYHSALNNDFIDWDVNKYIVENDHIKAFTWENIQWMWTRFYVANWHPLTWLSHALDYKLFGLQPWGHHLINILLHSLNGVLFLILSIQLLRFINNESPTVPFFQTNMHIIWTAILAALLFAIHPQHVESVVWIAERKDVLCLFFSLLTLIFYAHYVLNPRASYYFGALLCFILALLSKPMAMTLPLVLILIDIYPLQRITSKVSYQHLVSEKIPFFFLSLASSLITLIAQQSDQAVASLEAVGMQVRLLNAFNSLIFYISKFIFPIGLSPFYPLPGYTNFFESPLSLLPVLACLFITLISVYWWHRKHLYWLISWLFYVITLMPVLGIIQVGSQAAADRYTYFPMLPFYLLTAVGITTLYDRKKKSTLLGISVLIIVLAHLTHQQIFIWRNKLIFWNSIVLQFPNSSLAQAHLCRAYFKSAYFEPALEHCQIARSLGYQEGMDLNLLLIYIELKKIPEALATYHFIITHHLELGEDAEFIYYHIGQFYFEQGSLEKARELLEKTLELNPAHIQALAFLSLLP